MKQLPVIHKDPIKSIDLVKYSGASGDFNEIHTVPEIAESKGLEKNIVHGMYLMGWAAQAINEWFPDQKIARMKVRFQAITKPGEELQIAGTISIEGKGELIMQNSDGEKKLSGSFELKRLPEGGVEMDGIHRSEKVEGDSDA